MAGKQTGKPNKHPQKQPVRWPVFLAAAVLLVAAAVSVLLRGRSGTAPGGSADVQTISAGQSLVIDAAGVTQTARFYPVEVDGTQMEIIAVRDSEGTIRTAFNTCQICYSSGRGCYVQSGDALVCQNCGNRFTVDQVEIESGGCNPWPIFAENKRVTDETVTISYDYLKQATQLFANWKSAF